jgi:hypothetical protein
MVHAVHGCMLPIAASGDQTVRNILASRIAQASVLGSTRLCRFRSHAPTFADFSVSVDSAPRSSNFQGIGVYRPMTL